MARSSSPAAVGLLAFVALAAGVSPAHAWLDSGEIASAAAHLGVMHPTGVPGLMPLMHLASALPVGTLGFRFALVSAAFGAGTLAFISAVLRRREVPPAIVWMCALWLLAGLTFSRQARVVEIYTYASCLLAGCFWGFDPQAPEEGRLRTRMFGVFCAVLGVWGFGDLRLALALPVVGTWGWALRRRRAWAYWAPLAVGLATVAVFQIALSSARAPVSDWGDPDGARRLWQHLDASSIRAAFGDQMFSGSLGPWKMHGRSMVERLAEDLGPLGPMAALLALVWLLRDGEERPMWWMLVGLAIVEVVYVAGINPMGGADRQTGIPLALVSVLAVGLALGRVFGEGGPRLWLAGPLIAGVLVLPAAFLTVPDYAVTRSWAPHAWTRDQLARVPPEALLATQSDDLAAGTWAAMRIEGARPDIEQIPAQHLYRKLPDRAHVDGSAAFLKPAFEACGESRRARALVAAYQKLGRGPVVAEHPGSDMLAAVGWSSGENSGLGLVLGELGLEDRSEEVLAPSAFVRVVRAEVERLAPLLTTHEDRRRLAIALSSRVRAWLRVAGHDAPHNQAAIQAYRVLFEGLAVELPGPLVSLGALVDRAGDPDSAITLTREALVLDPDRRLAMNNLALYLSRDPATLEEALQWAERSAELYPRQAASWRRLEQVCAQAGQAECVARASARRVQLAAVRGERTRSECASVGTLGTDEGPNP